MAKKYFYRDMFPSSQTKNSQSGDTDVFSANICHSESLSLQLLLENSFAVLHLSVRTQSQGQGLCIFPWLPNFK